MAEKKCMLEFAVLGLGRLGMSIVRTLSDYDVNILACDKNPAHLHEAADFATHVVQADIADEDALEGLGLGNFDVVILTTGEDFEATILATMMAKELGAGYVVARAYGLRQKKILESVGADRVVLPETEMGIKLARNLVKPNIMDALSATDECIITEMHPLEEWVGKSIGDADIRHKSGYAVLAVIRDKKTIVPINPDFVIEENDILIAINEEN